MRAPSLLAVLALLAPPSEPAVWAGDFTLFESGHVRPLALSPDGATALRRQHARQPAGDLRRRRRPARTSSARCPSGSSRWRWRALDDTEVWVVNHLSDSISIVDVAAAPAARGPHAADRRRAARHRVRRAGRQPRLRDDGPPRPEPARTIRRAHHRGRRPRRRLGVRRRRPRRRARRHAAHRSSTLFGDTPRALGGTPDGSTVYAAVFHSGNQTTTHQRERRCATAGVDAGSCIVGGVQMPGGLPPPYAQRRRRCRGPRSG